MGDTGLSDTLSARLRETTPSLFSQSDAVVNKANEMVTMATAAQGKTEQWSLLRESLKVSIASGAVNFMVLIVQMAN